MPPVLVTIASPRQTLDLDVPVDTPIGELLPALLDAFTLATPPASGGAGWIVRATESGPFPPERTLADCHVVDGMRLVLQDEATYRWERERAAAVPQQIQPDAATGGIGVRWNRDGLLP